MTTQSDAQAGGETPARQSLLFFAASCPNQQRLEGYRRYLEALDADGGYQVSIMAPNDSPLAMLARDDDYPFFPLSDFSRTLLQRTPQLWPIFSAMRRFRFERILCHDGFACRGLKQIARKVIGVCHDDMFTEFFAADHLIVLNSASADLARDVFEDGPSISLLPYPYACMHRAIKPLGAEAGSGEKGKEEKAMDAPLTIGAGGGGAGDLDADAALGVFLNAAQLIEQDVPHTKFVIAGTGPEEDDLRLLAKQIAPQVEFVGPMSHEDMAERFDLYCLTDRKCAFSLSLCAMMDAGLCCVSTCANGPMDILKGGMVAPLVPIDEGFDLAVQLLDLLKDADQIRRIKSACFERVREEDFSIDEFVLRLGQLLRLP